MKQQDPSVEPEQTRIPRMNWNELQFLSWGEFKQMTPSILQLEVTRLGTLLRPHQEDTEFHNQLIRTRFALSQFIQCVKETKKDDIETACGEHLRTAIMSLSFPPEDLDTQTQDTCRYILDRLKYVHYRITLIY